MQNIVLEYQPFRFLKYTRKINGAFPSDFHELKPSQLITIAGLSTEKISETAFLSCMVDIPEFWIKRLDEYSRITLMSLFEPFLETKPYHSFIIPKIKIKGKILASPRQKLAGMTFARFIFAESYFASYQTDKNDSDLHKFVASLYLPENTSFDEEKIPKAALIVAKIKPVILDAIVINYILVKEWLALAYPMVFQQETENDENKTQKTQDKKNNNSAWLKIFESVVGDDLINQDRYAMIPLHNVLRWMSAKIKENMKRK